MEKKVYGFLVLSIIIGFTIGYLYQINNISTLKLNLKDLEIQSQKEKFNSDSNTKDIENYKNLSEYYKLKSEQYDSCRAQLEGTFKPVEGYQECKNSLNLVNDSLNELKNILSDGTRKGIIEYPFTLNTWSLKSDSINFEFRNGGMDFENVNFTIDGCGSISFPKLQAGSIRKTSLYCGKFKSIIYKDIKVYYDNDKVANGYILDTYNP